MEFLQSKRNADNLLEDVILYFKSIISFTIQFISIKINQWCAGQPKLALSLAIISSAGILPFVTATALTPLVFLLNLTDYIAEYGVPSLLYLLIFRWFILIILVIVLFIIGFVMVSSIGILYSQGLIK